MVGPITVTARCGRSCGLTPTPSGYRARPSSSTTPPDRPAKRTETHRSVATCAPVRCKDLRTIYAAVDETAAAAGLEAFEQQWGKRYPAMVRLWRAHWAEFTPFLAFPPDVRRVVYTTNLIESINARLRKVTRNRGQFPSEQAALKLLYLAVRNLGEFRSPSVGTRSSGWKQALQAFTIYFEGRIPTP